MEFSFSIYSEAKENEAFVQTGLIQLVPEQSYNIDLNIIDFLSYIEGGFDLGESKIVEFSSKLKRDVSLDDGNFLAFRIGFWIFWLSIEEGRIEFQTE